MSRRLWIGLAIAVAVLAFGATTATAHRSVTETQIVIIDEDFGPDPGFVHISGHLTSARAACLPGRTVVLLAGDSQGEAGNADDDFTFIDADLTSLRGNFIVEGTAPEGTDYFVLHVTRQNRAPEGHRHICGADTHITRP
jgi:hypothetical protein